MSLARPELSDLRAARNAVAVGTLSAQDLMAAALRAADSPACDKAFIRRFDAQARAAAQAVDMARAQG